MPSSRTAVTRSGTYTGRLGSLYLPVPPSADPSTLVRPDLAPVIQGLLTPGLVPDIARQSAEVSAGRGIAGSPAADSTAVKMSEQNYLQRLGLANTLLSGEASRALPYQITPMQSIQTALQQQALQNQRDIAQLHYGSLRPSGGGQAPVGATGNTPWAGFTNQPFVGQQPLVGATYGTRPDNSPATGAPVRTNYGGNMSLDEMIDSLLGLGSPDVGGDSEDNEFNYFD